MGSYPTVFFSLIRSLAHSLIRSFGRPSACSFVRPFCRRLLYLHHGTALLCSIYCCGADIPRTYLSIPPLFFLPCSLHSSLVMFIQSVSVPTTVIVGLQINLYNVDYMILRHTRYTIYSASLSFFSFSPHRSSILASVALHFSLSLPPPVVVHRCSHTYITPPHLYR